jgi:hypothetical protein
MEDAKDMLHRYLQTQRDAALWKLEGLGERDLRWPATPTGTNLLGLVKHLASIEFGYFGEVFGRTSSEPMPWTDEDAEDNADMWATADESPADIVAFYRRAWAFADQAIAERDLDAAGHVPWWGSRGDVTLHLVLVHVIAETARHAGHADVVRETLDGAAGLREGTSNLPGWDRQWWAAYRARLQRTAEEAGA